MAQTANLQRERSQAAEVVAPARPWTHGTFHWNELRTRDPKRAMAFYRDTLGWRFERSATPDGHDYWVAFQGEACVAGLFALKSPEFDGVPESWMSFLAVDDVDARVAKAVKAGAKLVLPIFDGPPRRPHRHAAGAERRRRGLDDARGRFEIIVAAAAQRRAPPKFHQEGYEQ